MSNSLISKIISDIYRYQGKLDDSINEANNSIKLFEDITNQNNDKLKNEKEKLTELIYNNYIQCSSLK